MFWKWFGSDRRVLEALSASTGYDAAPSFIQAPANTDEEGVALEVRENDDRKEYCFILPGQKKS